MAINTWMAEYSLMNVYKTKLSNQQKSRSPAVCLAIDWLLFFYLLMQRNVPEN
jgi:hypothetical protein